MKKQKNNEIYALSLTELKKKKRKYLFSVGFSFVLSTILFVAFSVFFVNDFSIGFIYSHTISTVFLFLALGVVAFCGVYIVELNEIYDVMKEKDNTFITDLKKKCKRYVVTKWLSIVVVILDLSLIFIRFFKYGFSFTFESSVIDTFLLSFSFLTIMLLLLYLCICKVLGDNEDNMIEIEEEN